MLRKIILTLVFLFITMPAGAEWIDDWIQQKTYSGPAYLEGQKRGFASAGSMSLRWKHGVDYPITIQKPRIKAGCGGIDLFLGGASFLNSDYLVDKLESMISAAPAIAFQIALGLRDEVRDLERAGIKAIQVDEPALREGLPLKRRKHKVYLTWAVDAFRLATACADIKTQVHTHMCYSDFNDIIESISAMDADVISIENARSRGELLDVFKEFKYDKAIGPGIYDIHSKRVPPVDEMYELLKICIEKGIPANLLWVNPDCGLKTRDWPETIAALKNMVAAAKKLRRAY